MATKNLNTRIQHKTDTAANWELAVNFRPLAGELIIFTYSDKPPRFKIGDGDSYVSGEPRNGHDVLEFTDKDAVTAEDITSGSLIDVIEDPATKSDGQVLTYDGTNEAWIAADKDDYDMIIQLNGTGDFAPESYTVSVVSGSINAMQQKINNSSNYAAVKMLCVVSSYYGDVIFRGNVVGYPYIINNTSTGYKLFCVISDPISDGQHIAIRYYTTTGWSASPASN